MGELMHIVCIHILFEEGHPDWRDVQAWLTDRMNYHSHVDWFLVFVEKLELCKLNFPQKRVMRWDEMNCTNTRDRERNPGSTKWGCKWSASQKINVVSNKQHILIKLADIKNNFDQTFHVLRNYVSTKLTHQKTFTERILSYAVQSIESQPVKCSSKMLIDFYGFIALYPWR
jgi:hypothetical protein